MKSASVRYLLLAGIFLIKSSLIQSTLCAQIPCQYSFFDQFSMTFATSFTHLTPNTVNGGKYIFEVTGTWGIANNSITRDGAYNMTPNIHVPGNCDACWLLNGAFGHRPFPDVYTPSHHYYYQYTGDGNPIEFSFYDTQYGDNAGQLDFTVYYVPDSSGIVGPILPGDTTVLPGTITTFSVLPDGMLLQDSMVIINGNYWKWLGDLNGHFYYSLSEVTTWTVGDSLAQTLNTSLACIEDAAEQAYLNTITNQPDPNNPGFFQMYWIGLWQNTGSVSYSEPAGGWEWKNGATVGFTNWKPAEPNNNSPLSDFVHLNWQNTIGVWNDASPENPGIKPLIESDSALHQQVSILWSTGETTPQIDISTFTDTTLSVWISNGSTSYCDTIHIQVGQPLHQQFDHESEELGNSQELKPMPNPTDGLFNLFIPADWKKGQTKKLNLMVMNSEGRQVFYRKELTTSDGHVSVDLSMLPEGLYFLRIHNLSGAMWSGAILLTKD